MSLARLHWTCQPSATVTFYQQHRTSVSLNYADRGVVMPALPQTPAF